LLYLAFATLTLLILGLIYAWSIFATPIGAQFEAYKPLLGRVFQVSMFAFCVSALGGAQICKRFSFLASLVIAALLVGVGFVLTALLAPLGIWVLFVCYGVLAASGVGIAYNAIISLVNPWFPDRVGLCSGVMMMGFGISSLIFGSLANLLIGSLGSWQLVFYLVAGVAIVITVIMAIVVKPAPPDLAARLAGGSVAQTQTAPTVESPTRNQNILKTKAFWMYFIWSIALVACGLMLIGSARQGAEALGIGTISPGLPVLLVGLVSTMNGLSRIINGSLFDRFGLIPVMIFCAVLELVAMIALAFSFGAKLPLIYLVAAILVAFPYGGVPVMSSAFARQRFRSDNFAMNLGINNLCIACAALINIIIDSIIGPVTIAGAAAPSAPVTYGILAALAVVALVFAWLFGRTYKADLKQIASETAAATAEADNG
jgi:OFA family oxalate/formate antiporter-like MFS transporter